MLSAGRTASNKGSRFVSRSFGQRARVRASSMRRKTNPLGLGSSVLHHRALYLSMVIVSVTGWSVVSVANASLIGAQKPDQVSAGRAVAEAERLRSQWEATSSRLAIEKYGQALVFWHSSHSFKKEADALRGIGEVYVTLGEHEKAYDYFKRALPLSRAASDRSTEILILCGIAEEQMELGELEAALEIG